LFCAHGPRAGSDAASIPDAGIICKGRWQGAEIVGIRLNFSKRYITLAPIATVIGLAFRLFDPEHLMGDKEDLGITCALIPRDTPGVAIGRRHFPLNIAFQNGPIQGRDVFVPVEAIIGGFATAGQGWRMLVEQLSVGRCISLPSSAAAARRLRCTHRAPMRASAASSTRRSAASRASNRFWREWRRVPTSSTRTFRHRRRHRRGEKPSVPSAMLKYHATEIGRMIANDAMDIHGGKEYASDPRTIWDAATKLFRSQSPSRAPIS